MVVASGNKIDRSHASRRISARGVRCGFAIPTEGAPMKALVIVDMLDDFVTGALANPHAERIVEPLARLLEHARARPTTGSSSSRTTRTTRPIPSCACGASTRWPAARARRSSPSWSRGPAPREIVSPKRAYGAFDGTGLDEQLQGARRRRGRRSCGQHTHICVRHSSYGALIRGYRVTVPRDARVHVRRRRCGGRARLPRDGLRRDASRMWRSLTGAVASVRQLKHRYLRRLATAGIGRILTVPRLRIEIL